MTINTIPGSQNERRSLSLRNRLLIAFILLASLSALLTGIVSALISAQNARTQAFAEVTSVAQVRANEINSWLSTLQVNLGSIMQDETSLTHAGKIFQGSPDSGTDKTELRKKFNELNKSAGYFNETFIIDKNGTILLSTQESQEGKIVKTLAYFQEGLNGPYIAPPAYDVALATYSILFAQPIQSGSGAIIGVIAGRANLDVVNKIMTEDIGLGKTNETYLVGSNYALLTQSRLTNAKIGETYIRTPGANSIIASKAAGSDSYNDYRDVPVLGAYLWVPSLQVALLSEQAQSEALQASNQAFIFTIGLMVLTMLVAAGAALLMTRSLVNPIAQLVTAAENITSGNLEVHARVQRNDEIGVLANSFNTMTARLRNLIGSLEQRVAERTRALATSTEVSRRLSTILDQDQLVREVVEQMQSAFGYYHTQIYLTDPTGQSLVMAGGTGEAGETLVARGHSLPKGRGLVGRAAETNTIVLVSDTGSDPDWLPNPLLPETKSELAVPIALGDQVIGVLDIQHNVTGGLTQSDADLIQSVANQVGVALQNARLFDQTQAALVSAQESRSALNEAMVVAGMASWRLSLETFRYTFDDRLYDMLGTTAEEEGGYELSTEEYSKKYIHPEDAAMIVEAIQTALQNPDPQNFKGSLEFRVIRKDGQIRYMLTDYRLVVNEQGKAIGSVGSFLDITERKQAEEALRQSEQLMRTVIDSTPDWIFIKDKEHRYRLVNQGYANSLHIALEDFIDKNDLDLGFPEELVKGNPEKGIRGFWSDDRLVMESNETQVYPDDPATIDGVVHSFHTIKTPLRDADGNAWGVLGFARDITERKLAEEAIAKRAAELATVAEVSTTTATSLKPDRLLQSVVDVTKERFSLYHAHIYLLDAEGDNLTLTAGAGEVGRKMVAQDWQIPLNREQSLVARAARTCQGVIINDVRAEPDFMPNELLPETRAEMAVPMIAGDKVLGVFDVQSDRTGSFSQEDTSIYTTLAAQVGIALQNARLFDQTQAALAQTEKLFEASRSLTLAADLQELVNAVVNTLNIPRINRAVLATFNYGPTDSLESLDIIANWWNGAGHEVTAIGTHYPLDVIRAMPMFVSPTPVFFNDTFNDERVDQVTMELVKKQNLRAVAVLPLHLGFHQIGALVLEAEEVHNFTQDEIRLFSALAPQIATMLENRRQFERTQKQAERESTLNVISQKIQGATTVEAALQIAARELGRALGAPLTIAQIGLKDRGNGDSRN